MFVSRLAKLDVVHEARTPEERHAVYAFRYAVYVEELGKELPGVDHERRVVVDDDDEADTSTILYTGSLDAVTSTVRIRAWPPVRVPGDVVDMFSLSLFPGIEDTTISEVGRLMIRPGLRGKLLLPALVREIYERSVQAGVDLAFCYCAPGLVRHYRKLGFRPYAAPLVPDSDGLHVPMVAILSDAGYLKSVCSPTASLVSKYYGRGAGKRRPFDVATLGGLLDPASATVELGSDKIWQEVQDGLMQHHTGSPILEGLTDAEVRKLTAKGFMIKVDAGTLVTRTGNGEREMFVVLDGALEVRTESDLRLDVLGTGELFGELAFFRDDGRRTATVAALSECHLLVIRRRFLDELARTDPKLALHLHFNLGRILAERLVRVERRVQI